MGSLGTILAIVGMVIILLPIIAIIAALFLDLFFYGAEELARAFREVGTRIRATGASDPMEDAGE